MTVLALPLAPCNRGSLIPPSPPDFRLGGGRIEQCLQVIHTINFVIGEVAIATLASHHRLSFVEGEKNLELTEVLYFKEN